MISKVLFNENGRKWIYFGRDAGRGETLIDTNEYLIIQDGRGMLVDPGGIEIFPSVMASVSKVIPIGNIDILFSSHQDPDVISSLGLWLRVCGDVTIYSSWMWGGFISHYGGEQKLQLLPDEGGVVPLGTSRDLLAVPAHYLHSPGNFSLHDPVSGILFSGDIGAALLPADNKDIFVKDFDGHIQYMEMFHRRWMPSNKAKSRWIEMARGLNISMICPQHGAIFKGDDVPRFLDWFDALTVGEVGT
ncbi:MAG: FprA family A-type flavoprotein [Deltaproteobacteria bacterium]|nr:FprA family A-type flavoprotein [Deltaproteobacteria bacterium]